MRESTALLLVALALAGCRPDPEAGGRIVLRVANWGGAKEGNAYDREVAAIYREFERRNPGIVVREESVPGEYVPKMILAFIARAQPDVMMLDASSAARFIEGGLVEDLSPRIARDPNFRLGDFFPNAVDVARRGARVYAIPQDFTPMVLYYNRRLFAEAGVAPPDGAWNFARFREAARRLTRRGSGGTERYGFAFSNWPAGWAMWLDNAGGAAVSPDGRSARGYLDSPESVRAVTLLRDVIRDGSAPDASQAASLGADPFVEGRAAMAVSGHWSLVGYAAAPKRRDGTPKLKMEEVGVAPMPTELASSRTVLYESGYAIAGRAEHKDAAWRFIRYMTSREVQRRYQASGIAISARKDVAAERARGSSIERAFLRIVPSARPPNGVRVESYELVEEEMRKAMDAVVSGGREVSQALASAARAVDREFAKR